MAVFLKLGDIKDESLDHKHNETLLRIDGDFLKLASANPDGSLKIDGQIEHDIAVISDSFLKLGQDFIKLSDVAIKIDDLFLKLDPTNFHIKLDPILDSVGGAVVDGGPPNPQADFLKLDTALKIAGADLGVLGTDFKHFDGTIKGNVLAQAEARVGQDFLKLNVDMTSTGQTFATLGDDFIKLSNGPNQELDAAYKLLGSELHKIGSAFDAVASDFLKLSQDFEILAGGRDTALVASSRNSQLGPLGTDFLKLDQDFLLLSQAIGGAFPGTAKVIDALLDQSGKPHGDEMHDTPPLLGVNHGSGH
jgi:hypothetical protein